jgi:hypothetical protein
MELYPVVQRWAHVNAAANFLQDQGYDDEADEKFADAREIAVDIALMLGAEFGLDMFEPAPPYKDTSVLGYWYRTYGGIAEAEGWSIFEAEFTLDERPGIGHDGEPCTLTFVGCELQVQVDTEVGRLVEDHDAWVLVMNGTGECHDLARRIIAEQSPVEFSSMLNYTKGWDL